MWEPFINPTPTHSWIYLHVSITTCYSFNYRFDKINTNLTSLDVLIGKTNVLEMTNHQSHTICQTNPPACLKLLVFLILHALSTSVHSIGSLYKL